MDFLSPHGRQLARHMGIELSPIPQSRDDLTKAVQEFKQPPPTRGFRPMRGLSRLTNLTNSVIAQMDQQADQIATEIQASTDRIAGAMEGFKEVNTAMKQTATEAEAVLKQLTNGPTSPAPSAG
jgi:hypothetical protein